MTDQQFHEWVRGRKRALLLMDTSEFLIAAIAGMWGVQILFVDGWKAAEPVMLALHQITPFCSVVWHGAGLICVAILHLYSLWQQYRKPRRICIFAELLFFSFAWFSLLMAHLPVPSTFVVPVYILGSVFNYMRPAKCRRKGSSAITAKEGMQDADRPAGDVADCSNWYYRGVNRSV